MEMDKESLIKIRNFLVGIYNLDIPVQDKVEADKNLSTLLEPENYDKHIKVLQKEFNNELRNKAKGWK